jgi:hypothetical protein
VAMARGDPGGCCSPGNHVRGCGRRVTLWASYDLDIQADSGAAGFDIVVGELFGGLIEVVSERVGPLEASALFISSSKQARVITGLLVREIDLSTRLSSSQG